MVVVGRFIISFGPDLNGGWSLLTGDCYSEKDLVLNLLGTDLEWSLLTGGFYLELVVSAGLTIQSNLRTTTTHGTQNLWPMLTGGH